MWLYLITEPAGEPTKIGVAACALNRARGLQIGNPQRLSVWGAIWAEDRGSAYALENAAQERFHDRRLCGEWFGVSAADVVEFLGRKFSLSDGAVAGAGYALVKLWTYSGSGLESDGVEHSRQRARAGHFDRLKYQREYMRDREKAKKAGMTVHQWRVSGDGV